MSKYFALLITLLLLHSCSTDPDSPAFIIEDKVAEVVDVELSVDAKLSPFYYLIQSNEMIIDWDNNTPVTQYSSQGIDVWKIKPIEYFYKKPGTYTINIRCKEPYCFDFSKGIDGKSTDNVIHSIKLQNCTSLQRLYCRNQSLTTIDLRGCSELSLANFSGSQLLTIDLDRENKLDTFRIDSSAVLSFDCSYLHYIQQLGIGAKDNKQQRIYNFESLSSLRSLYVNGCLYDNELNVTKNDSLQNLLLANSNLRELDLSGLTLVQSIGIRNNANLKAVKLSNNSSLDSLVLVDNSLDAEALNHIFRGLPSQTNTDPKVIVLRGNAGDNNCDRTIAIKKGWSFK